MLSLLSIVQASINNQALGSLGSLTAPQFVQGMLSAIIQIALVGGALIFIFMLILGGIKWITSAGDKGQLESARKTLSNALIGIVLVFCLYAIVNVVGCFFGLNFTQISIGNFSVSFGLCNGKSGPPGYSCPPGQCYDYISDSCHNPPCPT